jgi:ABC-type bacteriocin/lantibiotic exporter with double-glycine peptidase domain
MILNVPYTSQVGNQYRNDCGEACAAMIAGYAGKVITIDQMQRAMGRVNQTDTLGQLGGGLEKFGIETRIHSPVNIGGIAEFVRQGKPPICLVTYSKIPKYAKTSTYTGGHFVVVVGVDTHVQYHDPLGRANQRITKQEWDFAFQSQCLVNTVGYLPATPTNPLPPEGQEMDEHTFLKHWVPFVRDQRRRTNKLLGAYVAKPNPNGQDVAMYDKEGRIVKVYASETQYNDDGWRSWADVGDKNWAL